MTVPPPQVKELGAAVYNCSCLAQDLRKIFEAYWALGVPGASIPAPWPENYSTAFNMETPLELKLNDTAAAVYFSVRPRIGAAVGVPRSGGGGFDPYPVIPAELPAASLRRRSHPGSGRPLGRHRRRRGLRRRRRHELPPHHRILPPPKVPTIPRRSRFAGAPPPPPPPAGPFLSLSPPPGFGRPSITGCASPYT